VPSANEIAAAAGRLREAGIDLREAVHALARRGAADAIVPLLDVFGALRRNDLVALLNRSKRAISEIVRPLLDDGTVTEEPELAEERGGRRGPSASWLRLHDQPLPPAERRRQLAELISDAALVLRYMPDARLPQSPRPARRKKNARSKPVAPEPVTSEPAKPLNDDPPSPAPPILPPPAAVMRPKSPAPLLPVVPPQVGFAPDSLLTVPPRGGPMPDARHSEPVKRWQRIQKRQAYQEYWRIYRERRKVACWLRRALIAGALLLSAALGGLPVVLPAVVAIACVLVVALLYVHARDQERAAAEAGGFELLD
jgi:hypothetical protein